VRSLGLTRGPESGGSHGVTLTVDGRMTDVRGMLAREMMYQAAEKKAGRAGPAVVDRRGTTVTESPLSPNSMD
jgi:hypothetical protein